ncbi:OLC1v1033932C1 [Oldenlandia corymbosa var. corymbosa]|uniref:OLC1v1033932C1 n=1 Tax=Oldenlandia corymbosa var. corymbosa TaxID=529605 RepID=A0AAV1CQS4_OLDCO|nr:OLC1v1033932C1 [Oldenlandia corymbosa var. corymbosa]
MPPKSGPARRFTPRKSVLLPVSSGRTSASSRPPPTATPPPPAAATTTAAATATAASRLSLRDNGQLTSPNIKPNPKAETKSTSGDASSPANPSPIPQGRIKKIVPKPGKKIPGGDQIEKRAVTKLVSAAPVSSLSSSQDAIIPRPKVPAAGGAGAEEQGSVGGGKATAPETLGVVKDKGEDKVSAEAVKVATKAVGSAKVGEPKTRKVLKKRMRIVKKIVKRKVPKRVVPDSKGCEETKGGVSGLNSTEVEKLNSHSYPEMESVTNVDIAKAADKSLEISTDALSPREVGMAGHCVTSSFESEETCKIDCTATLTTENGELNETQRQAEEITEIDSYADRIVGDESENAGELRDSTRGSDSAGIVADENDGNRNLVLEDQLDTMDSKLVKMEVDDHLEDSSGGTIQEGRLYTEEKNDAGLIQPLALSGEMEALERRKRRRTEIFIGGLDKDTKEEDVRKRFEQIGEVKQVRLVKGSDSGKNKGFAFLQFVSAADAKKALEKFSTIEICGKQCGLRPVEGNDTIFLGNINKNWKSEDVLQHLKIAKVQNIDKVIVMANPNNFKQNRGFAFVEFQTTKDAQIAFSKLQKYDLFIKQMKIKVAWAQPLVEPDEEEILKVKSVYAEYLPSSWDEGKARNFFKRFGEIESITLAKNLPSSWRKDYAFINYSTREAALACIEAFTHEQVDDSGSKVAVKVSLAKPKVKQSKPVSNTIGKEHVNEKRITSNFVMVHEPLNKEEQTSKNLQGIRVDRTSTTTDELLRLLRQQAREGQPQPGGSAVNHHHALAGSKRPFSALGLNAIFSEPRALPRSYPETSHLYGSTSAVSSRVDTLSLPYYQRQRMGYTHELPSGFQEKPPLKPREQPPSYVARSGMYQRF